MDDDVGSKGCRAQVDGVYELRESGGASIPEGEAAAHVVGSPTSKTRGRKASSWLIKSSWRAMMGAPCDQDRLGRVVESVGDLVPAEDGQPVNLSLDAKIQFYAYQCIRDAVAEHKAKAGSVVVLDALTGEVLALANVPSYTPADRRNLDWRAIAQSRPDRHPFEPGSTMKPLWWVSIALETGRVKPGTIVLPRLGV